MSGALRWCAHDCADLLEGGGGRIDLKISQVLMAKNNEEKCSSVAIKQFD